MIKNSILSYYYGEFGYFNFVVLGHLEELFLHRSPQFYISTYKDYHAILDIKFPGAFKLLETREHPQKDAKRKYHRIHDDEFNLSLQNSGFYPLENILRCEIRDWREGRKKIKPIKSMIGTSTKEKKFISVSCRKRHVDPDRNLTPEQWIKIFTILKKTFPTKDLVIHGLPEESVNFEDQRFCSNINTSVEILNQSEIFVSSMSGFGQFASNCGCPILQIGPSRQMIPYNPFNLKNICIERHDLNSFEDILAVFIRHSSEKQSSGS